MNTRSGRVVQFQEQGEASTQQESSSTLPNTQPRMMETPNSHQPNRLEEPEDDLNLLTEEQLDQALREARETHRLRRKRDYVRALREGRNPGPNPDLADDQSPTRDPKRARNEGSAVKMTLPDLKYKEGTGMELTLFLVNLKGRFGVYPASYRTDAERLLYATSCFEPAVHRRWGQYIAADKGGGDLLNATWKDLEDWLKSGVGGESHRAVTSHTDLAAIQQGDNESVASYWEHYEIAAAENQPR
ncbi:hypothetical protein GGR54DRAFT_185578 [Hypoxylon sp. NC1633]|nr:hypothetical protein GGR54DRAFT_185578 [Hypoxylon sp. NC1633]